MGGEGEQSMNPRVLVIGVGKASKDWLCSSSLAEVYEVVFARDLSDAVSGVTSARPSVIVLEVRVPEQCKSLVEKLDEHPHTRGVPLLFLTELVSFNDTMMELAEKGFILQKASCLVQVLKRALASCLAAAATGEVMIDDTQDATLGGFGATQGQIVAFSDTAMSATRRRTSNGVRTCEQGGYAVPVQQSRVRARE